MKCVKKAAAVILSLIILGSSLAVSSADTPNELKFIQSITLDGLRNANGDTAPVEAGWGGMKITVGKKDLYVTEVGRMNADGSAKKHNMLIVDASDNSLVKDGISINTPNDAKAKEFVYAKISGVVLKAGKSYYIVADFQGAKDAWYDKSTAVTTKDAAMDGYVMLNLSTNAWAFTKAANIGYGPVTFKYTLEKPSAGSKESTSTSKGSDMSSKGSSQSGENKGGVTESRSIDEILKTEEIHAYVNQYFLNGKRNITIGDAGNYAGWVGMKITVGPEAMIVTALGRIYGEASDAKHNMIIINADTNEVVIDNVKITGETKGKISYVNLPKPVVLQAGMSYYIATDVMSWTDEWYDSTTITTNSAAQLKGAVLMGLNGWEFFDVPVSWGPVDFKYVKTKSERSTESKIESSLVSSGETTSEPVSQDASDSAKTSGSGMLIMILVIGTAALIIAGAAAYYVFIRRKRNTGNKQ